MTGWPGCPVIQTVDLGVRGNRAKGDGAWRGELPEPQPVGHGACACPVTVGERSVVVPLGPADVKVLITIKVSAE